jgi:osmoprotectant transport system permease protein
MEGITGAFGWLTDPAHWQGANGIPTRFVQHVELSVLAVVVALVIAVPIGLYTGHTGRGGGLALNVAGLGRAIPSYALLLVFFPILGFGLLTPLVALVLLSIPPILANTHVGLRGVDRETVDAARGMGMRESQVLTRVELPAALPILVAGIRTAAVATVATANLAALIAGGGFGRYIVDGFALQDQAMLVYGAILVAVLAVVTERGLTLIERRLVSPGIRLAQGAGQGDSSDVQPVGQPTQPPAAVV